MKIGRSQVIVILVLLSVGADLLVNLIADSITEFNPALIILALVGITLLVIISEIRNPDRNDIVLKVSGLQWKWAIVSIIALAAIFMSVFYSLRNELSVPNILILVAHLTILFLGVWQFLISNKTDRKDRVHPIPGKYIDRKPNRLSPYATDSKLNSPRRPERTTSDVGEQL